MKTGWLIEGYCRDKFILEVESQNMPKVGAYCNKGMTEMVVDGVSIVFPFHVYSNEYFECMPEAHDVGTLQCAVAQALTYLEEHKDHVRPSRRDKIERIIESIKDSTLKILDEES